MPRNKPTKERPAQQRGLRPNPHKLGVRLLEEGEDTRVYRVRGPHDLLDWFSTFNSEERGEFLQRARAALQEQETRKKK
ncbi:hypothetical protein [Deinococcus pimensis]|uniref:hypothetical protein n=1 Tax=Deinococcus pimensis TaxID=309888 RepID=UPI000485398E|nr:hypothetical protein [Deinococcus pimensis]